MNSETRPVKMGQSMSVTLSYFGPYTIVGEGKLSGIDSTTDARFYIFTIDKIIIDGPDTYNVCDLIQPFNIRRHPREINWT